MAGWGSSFTAAREASQPGGGDKPIVGRHGNEVLGLFMGTLPWLVYRYWEVDVDTPPLVSLLAPSPARFGRGQEASRAMGQPWSSDRANKHWGRGVTISKTEYLRPQYLPRAYEPPRKQ